MGRGASGSSYVPLGVNETPKFVTIVCRQRYALLNIIFESRVWERTCRLRRGRWIEIRARSHWYSWCSCSSSRSSRRATVTEHGPWRFDWLLDVKSCRVLGWSLASQSPMPSELLYLDHPRVITYRRRFFKDGNVDYKREAVLKLKR